MRFSWKQKNGAQFRASKFLKSSHWPEILFKSGKQCVFLWNCPKRSFQVMRSTFLPNRILERQSSQNRHAGLKYSPKRENSAPSMKIVQNALFRSCAALFGQIAFFRFKVLTLAWNSRQNGKTAHFPWKLYKNAVFRSCAARFGQIAFLSVKVLKIVTRAWNSLENDFFILEQSWTVRLPWKVYTTLFSGHAHFFKTEKQCAFQENCTKPAFQVMRSTFWPNRIFERQISQIRETGLKFSSKRKKSALFRSCAFLQNRKTVRIFERQIS